ARIAPLGSIPGVDARPVDAFVVAAGRADRLDDAVEADGLDAGRVDVEVLGTPADIFAGDDLLLRLGLRHADRLDHQHRRYHSAVIEHRADILLLRCGAL